MKRNIFDLTRQELEEYFLSIGEKKFKALQVYEWIYEKREYNIDNFSNIFVAEMFNGGESLA